MRTTSTPCYKLSMSFITTNPALLLQAGDGGKKVLSLISRFRNSKVSFGQSGPHARWGHHISIHQISQNGAMPLMLRLLTTDPVGATSTNTVVTFWTGSEKFRFFTLFVSL